VLEEPDFSAITDFVENDGEEIPVETVAEETETPAEETPPETPSEPVVEAEDESVVAAEEETPPEKVAAEEKETPPAETPVEKPEPTPELVVPTEEELEGMYQEHRTNTLPTLEALFQLSDEDAAALDEQPSKMIPKLAGQMMYDTMLSTYNAVLAAMPSVVNRLIQASGDADKASSQFYDEWPDLNNAKSRPAVSAAIKAFKSANPRAELPEVIKQAGVMAMINMGLDPTKARVETPVAVRTTPVAPARPAAPGGAPPTPPAPRKEEDGNIFAELAQLHDEEFG
jgi:hypothetical protein